MTSEFRSALVFQDDGGLPYTLFAALVYNSALLNRSLLIPAGFKTDLASIPRGLWNLLPKSGGYDKAAVVHDFLYTNNGVTRAQADAVLNEAMHVCGVGTWTRRLIFVGVRVGGWKPWSAYRAQEVTHVS